MPPQPPLLGVERDATNRGTRAVELLSADASISQAELEAIKYDSAVSRQSWAGGWFAEIEEASHDETTSAGQVLLREWDWNFDGRGAADAGASAQPRLPTSQARMRPARSGRARATSSSSRSGEPERALR